MKKDHKKREFLTPKEEQKLIVRWQKKGDIKARDKVLFGCVPMVRKMAGDYLYHHKAGYAVGFEDLMQEGLLGMLKAMEMFDIKQEVRFITYAQFWVISYFQRCAEEKCSGPLSITYHRRRQSKQWCLTGIPLEEIQSHLQSSEESAEERVDRKMAADVVKELMKELSPRERKVLELRYGLGDGRSFTLDQLGYIFKLSRERIRQVEVEARKKLRSLLEKRERLKKRAA